MTGREKVPEVKICPRCGVPVPVSNIAQHDHFHASVTR